MAAAGTATLDSLSDDVLGAIFMLLIPMVRAGLVPRVCRRWHRITANASMWPDWCLAPRDSSVAAWLRQRSPGLRHLTFHQGPSYACNGAMQSRGASGADIICALAAVAPSATQLQHLALQLSAGSKEDAATFDVAQLACISHLRSLISLEIYYIGTPFQPVSLDNMLACLPALEVVSLEFRKASDPAAAATGPHAPPSPLAFPCSLLRCTRLTSMNLSATYTSPHVCSIPAGITALQRLQYLGLQHCVRAPLPRSLSQMTRLTSLGIMQFKSEFQELLLRDHDGPVLLPTSLEALDVPMVPAESLCQLTALQRLRLTASEGQPSDASRFSVLERLTSLQLDESAQAIWTKFEGCTGLQSLHLHGWDTGQLLPLPYQQLTGLQLQDGDYDVRDILIMISELPRLEVLEVLAFTCQALELRAFDAAVLSRLPKLRRVDLSGSLLWDGPSDDDTSGHEPVQGNDMVQYLPVRVVQQLMDLQRAYPNITWVVDEY